MKTFSEFSSEVNLAIADRLKSDVLNVMELTGMEQRQIARVCGMDPANFSRIINGKYSPAYNRVVWIHYVLCELSADYYASHPEAVK